ncbi:MAG: TonB-dependent receptor [Terracidiphilus sp.]|jgi:hypothetical protein
MRFIRLQNLALTFTVAFLGLVLGILPCSKTASAQGIITGGISGSVGDQTGAAIPGANVKAVSESTGTLFEVKANGEGEFEITTVPLGSYTITITASGFGVQTLSHVEVVAGNVTPLGKLALHLGAASQTVEVAASASELINTESAQVETSIALEQVATAPVAGAVDNMALMVPGVVNTHQFMSNTNGISYSVNGQRGRSNNSEIDGQTNNDTSIGGPSFFFDNQDALQEVQVLTSGMSAEYGHTMGATINYITKGGSNTFHGSGFEIYTGSWLSSLMQYQKDPNFGGCAGSPDCNIQAPKFVQNNWGGTFGGPILKNKLWFFGSTLWSHTFEGGVVLTSQGALFPDPNGLATLKSSFPNNAGVAALTMNGPYSSTAGSPTPLSASVTTVPVTDGNTTANVEVAGYQRTFPNAIFDQEHLGRIDYNITPKDRFYLRYNYQNNPYFPAFYLVSAATAAGGGYPNVIPISHEVGADWTHTFTSNIVNQLRYAFQQSSIGFYGGSIPNCTISNFDTCTSTVELGGSLATYGYGAGLPQGRIIKVDQFQDNAHWNHGRHTIMFGAEFDSQHSPWGFLPNAEGAFNFTPGAAGALRNTSSNAALSNGLTAILEGVTSLDLAQGNPNIPFKEKDYGLYFQDDFKFKQNLTINLGLRYEYFGQSANFLHDETVAQQTGSQPFWSTALPLSATTVPTVNPNYDNIEPRIGFAYTPNALPKLVVHGGYFIDVDPVFYEFFVNIATAAPAVNSGTLVCDGVTVNCVPATGLTYSTVHQADAPLLPPGGDPRTLPNQTVPSNFRNAMGETYTLGIQYQVVPQAVASISYLGNHTFRQYQALNSNPDILDVQSVFPNYGAGVSVCTDPTATGYTRPNCNYDQVETYGNTAFQIYNALQASLTYRNFHGFTGTASYTYSREIDNASEFAGTGTGGGTVSPYAQNPLNPDIGERGVSGFSYPSIWGIQMTYAEPWFSGQRGILGRLLGGYYMNAFYQYNGGTPFNAIQNSYSVTSSNVLADIAGSEGNPGNVTAAQAAAINTTQAEYGFCDVGFTQAFGGNPCRPVLSNKSAPLSSIGINLGPGGYVDYVTGAPTTPAQEHWTWNNQYQAVAASNPFPGVGRNTLRGDSFNDIDVSVGKNFKIAERIAASIQVSAFNLTNRAFYGIPDPNVEDSGFGGFMSSQYAFGTGPGSGASGGSYPQGLGNRNVQLTGKVTF